MSSQNKRVLLIDDHPLFRLGLTAALASASQRIKVHEAATLQSALAVLAAEPGFDLIVYDWRLHAHGGGVKGLVALLQIAPGVPVMVVSGIEEEAVRETALHLGAVQFISKGADAAEMRDAVVSTLHRAHLLHSADGREAQPCTLTPRQLEVLRLMAKGWANKLIANRLKIADTTVRAHVSEILHLMKVSNRVEAVVLAYRTGMV